MAGRGMILFIVFNDIPIAGGGFKPA